MPQDETAFAQFYARQVNTVYRICYVKLKNQMDAEDVTQEVFLRAMQQPQLWGDDAHAKAWLIVTASNLCKKRCSTGHVPSGKKLKIGRPFSERQNRPRKSPL